MDCGLKVQYVTAQEMKEDVHTKDAKNDYNQYDLLQTFSNQHLGGSIDLYHFHPGKR